VCSTAVATLRASVHACMRQAEAAKTHATLKPKAYSLNPDA
jgi:hypothetical protein